MERKKIRCDAIEPGGMDRRTVIRSLSLGALVVSAGQWASGAVRAAEPPAPTAAEPPPTSAAAPSTQAGWRWCHKCEGMFYAVASAGMGHCPAGGAHDAAGSGHYLATIGETVGTHQQGGWRWCHKCEGMFYAAASAGKGHCPAGAAHDDAGSGRYAFLLGA